MRRLQPLATAVMRKHSWEIGADLHDKYPCAGVVGILQALATGKEQLSARVERDLDRHNDSVRLACMVTVRLEDGQVRLYHISAASLCGWIWFMVNRHWRMIMQWKGCAETKLRYKCMRVMAPTNSHGKTRLCRL
jgi:hypothetical protein